MLRFDKGADSVGVNAEDVRDGPALDSIAVIVLAANWLSAVPIAIVPRIYCPHNVCERMNANIAVPESCLLELQK